MKIQKINLDGIDISIQNINEKDFICITDIIKAFPEKNSLLEHWLRTKSTIGYLGAWEQLENKNFNYSEFEGIKNRAFDNAFTLSVKDWVNRTNAIGIRATSGRYGGTYAHKDIAFEFCTTISPEFKLLIIKEYQRLKEKENEESWDYKRMLAKTNYRIHTDAIKNYVDVSNISKEREKWIYAEEADMLNLAVFGKTAKQWREENPNESGNIRDYGNVLELIILSNLEGLNSYLISNNISKEERLKSLCTTFKNQYESLKHKDFSKLTNPKLLNK